MKVRAIDKEDGHVQRSYGFNYHCHGDRICIVWSCGGAYFKGGTVMRKYSQTIIPVLVLITALLCSAVEADTLSGLPDVTVVSDAVVSLRYAGTEYVVADGDLATGTTTRWYVIGGVEYHWPDGDPVPAGCPTVATTSNPKPGDIGANADDFLFRLAGVNHMSSIDGINFQQTVFPFLTNTIFIFERGGNDSGTVQAIFANDTLGAPLTLTAGTAPYANTGVNVGGQNAFGYVLTTDVPVKGLRITASGHDALSVSTPAGTDPRKAHDPQPDVGEEGVVVTNATLSWRTGLDPADSNNPNPNIIEHYLWLSKPYNPMNPPAGPDWDDPAVQTFTIGADTNPADGNVDPNASKAVPGLQKDSLYFWAVDEGLTGSSGPLETDPAKIIVGHTWIFRTETTGPQVDAGDSVVTWLKEGTTTVDVNGTVADGTGDVTVIRWSVLTAPFGATVDIANTAVAATTATLTETGTYVLQLYARDATMLEDSDAIEIKVYNDGCEAAKNSPDGYTAPPYDFNGDCIENFNDFALFAARWLEDASLMSDLLYDAGDITLPVVQFTNPLDSSTVSGQVIINVIAYDPGVGATDGDGMEGAGIVRFQVFDSTGAVVGTQDENTAPFDMTWNTAAVDAGTLPVFPNGVYTIRVTAESDAGYIVIKEISVTVNNP